MTPMGLVFIILIMMKQKNMLVKTLMAIEKVWVVIFMKKEILYMVNGQKVN